jgi:O-antigen/teichoic acid export membrane protein
MRAPSDELAVRSAPLAAERSLFRRLMADSVRVFCGQTATVVTAMLAGIIIVRTVGPAGKGSLAYAATIVALLTTAFGGVATASVLAIARGHVERTQAERATLRTALFAGVGAAGVLLVLSVFTPHRIALLAAAAAATPALIAAGAVMLLRYRGQIGRAILVQQIGSTGSALAGVVVVLAGGGVSGAFACWILALAISALVGRRRLGAAGTSTPGGNAPMARMSVVTTVLAVVAYLNLTIDVYVVAGTRTPVELGLYTLGIASGEMLWELGKSLIWPALGPIADLPREQAAQLVTRLFRQITAIVGLAAIAAWFAGPLAIRLVYGERFAPSGEILRMILPGIVAMAAELPLGTFVLLALSGARSLLALQIASTVACAAICLVGLPHYGLIAAAFATSLTYCMVFAAVLVLAMRGGVTLRALF